MHPSADADIIELNSREYQNNLHGDSELGFSVELLLSVSGESDQVKQPVMGGLFQVRFLDWSGF